MTKPFLLVITGPTAVGKTDLVLKIAESIPSEIINVDSGQFYTPLTIGTAKPDWRNEPVPHHLFDIIDTPTHFSVTEFRKRLLETATQIISRKKLPIVVGGSAFYVKSLFFPPKPTIASTQGVIPGEISWERLYALDPQRAQKIHKNDSYRIGRALALWENTGTLPSSLAPDYEPPMPFHCIILTRDKDDLYQRINERVVQMLEQGWVNEVENLQSTPWEEFLKTKKIIGYDVILECLKQGLVESHKDEMIALIQKKTRQYAKRQLTFFKMLEKQIEEEIRKKPDAHGALEDKIEVVNLTLLPVDLYIRQLLPTLLLHTKNQT
jgi:tRNA dimethylallyltransferase